MTSLTQTMLRQRKFYLRALFYVKLIPQKKAYNFILITNMTNALQKQQEQEHVTRSIFCW